MVVVLLLFKRVVSHYICPEQRSSEKEKVFGGFPYLCCPERWSGLNRLSHSDWVKLCIDPKGRINLCAKQKCEILSATNIMMIGGFLMFGFVFFYLNKNSLFKHFHQLGKPIKVYHWL